MRIINDLGYPDAYIKICETHSYKPDPSRKGVTSLIDSPLIGKLLFEQWDNIVVPASDFFTGILGTSFHKSFEAACPAGHTAEKKWEHKIENLTLVGKADLTNGGIEDYKLMSAWSWVFDKEKHFTEQLNLLNRLRQWAGEKPAEFLRIHAFIKDWSFYQAQQNKDYPQQKYFSHDVEIWPNEKTDAFIAERLKIHTDPNYKCTDEDRWIRVEKFAVLGKGQKRAIRLTDSYAEAEQYILEKGLTSQYKSGTVYIEQRRSEPKRCKEYCICRSVCPFAKSIAYYGDYK